MYQPNTSVELRKVTELGMCALAPTTPPTRGNWIACSIGEV